MLMVLQHTWPMNNPGRRHDEDRDIKLTTVALVPSVTTVVVAITRPRGVDANGGARAKYLPGSAGIGVCV